jgi:hypothetical protein
LGRRDLAGLFSGRQDIFLGGRRRCHSYVGCRLGKGNPPMGAGFNLGRRSLSRWHNPGSE